MTTGAMACASVSWASDAALMPRCRIRPSFCSSARVPNGFLAAAFCRDAQVDDVPDGLEGIGEFAGRTFDYHAAHPELVRLLLWEGLSGGPPADEVNRTAHYQHKAQAYAAAQRAGLLDDDLDPDHLVFLIIALAAWWISAPQLARMLTGADDSEPAEHARRRASVVRAAERLARPRH